MAQPLPQSSVDALYAPPAAAEGNPFLSERLASARRLRTRSLKLLAASVVGFAVSVGVLALNASGLGALLLLATSAVAVIGFGHAAVALAKGVGAKAGAGAAFAAVGLGLGHVLMTCLGMFTALLSTMAFTRGRQIRSAGKILLPPVESGDTWTRPREGMLSALAEPTLALDLATRQKIADQWRENGRTEHASVAAFARLSLDLIALGAPPALVASANQDALDEIRHAEQCFALARALDGRAASPGAFPAAARARTLSRVRSIALAELAVDSLVDGALHEGVSARIVARLARRAEDPAIAAMMKSIAADEGRHSRHGWNVVRFCLEEGGESVAHALEGALAMLPPRMSSPMPDEARDGRWEPYGLMGEALEAEELDAARADIGKRLRALVALAAPAAKSAAA